MERLVLVLAVAYAWMITQGNFVFNGDDDTWHEVVDCKRSKYSIFRSVCASLKEWHKHRCKKSMWGFTLPHFTNLDLKNCPPTSQQPEGDAEKRVRRTGGATRWIIDHKLPLTVPDIRDDPFTANQILYDYGNQATSESHY